MSHRRSDVVIHVFNAHGADVTEQAVNQHRRACEDDTAPLPPPAPAWSTCEACGISSIFLGHAVSGFMKAFGLRHGGHR